MAQKRVRRELYVATKAGFVSGIGRVDIGDVAVEGHVVLRRAAAYFRPLVPRFGTLPEADAEPDPANEATP
jgi:hypothetical protein